MISLRRNATPCILAFYLSLHSIFAFVMEQMATVKLRLSLFLAFIRQTNNVLCSAPFLGAAWFCLPGVTVLTKGETLYV